MFETIEAMEEQLKDKQGTELDGQQIFLDYTNDKSSHVSIQKKGLRGFSKFEHYMSRGMGFPTMWYVRPAKPPISLRIGAV